jgi:hypothetical protein
VLLVANVCFKYFKCLRGMLQVFHLDIAKVDPNVAYVVMIIYICCKRLFKMFHLFQTYVASVLSGCCICFIHMLQVYVSTVFRSTLHQVFHVASIYS